MMYELPPAMRAVLHATDDDTSAALRSAYRSPHRRSETRVTPRHRESRRFRIFNVDMGGLLTPAATTR